MKINLKRLNWQRIISAVVLLSLIWAVIYTVIALVNAPSDIDVSKPYTRLKSDYVLMLLQCIVGILAILLPGLFIRKFKIQIQSYMIILYTIFLYCAIYLGEVRSFYYTVPHWDTILHTFSGAMLGALGFSFVNILNKTERVPVNLSPVFVATFAFCFAVALGTVWEIYEFTADGILQTNMQKFALENGDKLIGRDALSDTMKDIIVDCIGALAMSVIGYFSLKLKKGWIEKFQITMKKHDK